MADDQLVQLFARHYGRNAKAPFYSTLRVLARRFGIPSAYYLYMQHVTLRWAHATDSAGVALEFNVHLEGYLFS